MKQFTAFLLAMLMIATPLSVLTVSGSQQPTPATPLWVGDGSIGDPYQISNVTELQWMGNLSNLGMHFILTGDIDASETSGWNAGAGFVPVGTDANSFTGTLDGNNRTITGLYIYRTATDYVGLFGCVGATASISNVGLVNFNITGNDMVGGFAGINDDGTITNCYSTGNASGNYWVGGFAGYSDGTITDCYSTGDASGNQNVGGFAGVNGGTITNCYSTGNASGDQYVGGFAGVNGDTITNCYCTGNASGTSEVGGFTGYNDVGGTITDCYSTGNASGSNYVGGFAGGNVGTITNCYSTGKVTGVGVDLGGFTGSTFGTITECFWDNETSEWTTSDGAEIGRNTDDMMNNFTFTNAGWDFTNVWWMVNASTRPFLRMEWSTEIHNSHQLQLMQMDLNADYTLASDINLGDIVEPAQMWGTSPASGGGFFYVGNSTDRFTGSFNGCGYSLTGLFINRTATDYIGLFGATSASCILSNVSLLGCSVSGFNYVGGLVGHTLGSTVSNCSATGDILGLGERIGGIVGYHFGTIMDCSAVCNVNGTFGVGAVVGANFGGTVSNCSAAGNISGSIGAVGGLVGNNGGPVSNCHAACNISSGGDYAGGLLGFNGASVSNCTANGRVNGTGMYVGGLIGENNGHLSDSHAYADIIGAGIYSGGLAGYNDVSVTIFNCSAHGNLTGTSNYCGGLAGRNVGKIENCSAHGNAGDVASWTGGLVGDNFNGAIVSNCSAYGNATGMTYVGGLAGNNAGALLNSSSLGAVAGGDDVGGLVGYNSGTVNSTTSSSAVSGQGYVGGLVGFNSGSVSYSSASGAVTSTSFRTGGLIGGNEGGGISYCYATGRVNGTAIAGGLVGYYGETGASLTTCFATGNVTGTMNLIGGFVGYQFNMPISNCYARGNVVGSTSLGGFAGGERGDITNCYSTGTVTGISDFGGFRGVHINGTLSDCHWDNESSGTTDGVGNQEPDPPGLFGNDTVEMMQQATFAGWDFTNIWGIYETNSYPFLKAVYIPPEPQADLEITLMDMTDPATVGSILTYIGTVINHGPDNALDVKVNITLPIEVTHINHTGTMTVNGRYITGDPGFVGSGVTLVVFINVSVDSYGPGVLNCTGLITATTSDAGAYPNETYETTAVNRPPIPEAKNWQTTEDYVYLSYAPGVLWNANDLDGPGDIANITVTGHEPSDYGAAITILADGNFTYDPTVSSTLQALHGGVSVYDTFNYTISDGRGGIATATITMQVDGQDGMPTAVDDTFMVAEDSVANIFNVLSNDIANEEGDTIILLTPGSTWQGTLALSANGTALIFTPAANYNGIFYFHYQISNDGTATTDSGNVTVTVTGVNDAPIIGTIVNDLTVLENESYSWNYTGDDLVDGDTVTWTLVSNATWLSINSTTGVLSGIPPFHSAGNYSVNITLSDGHGAADWLEFTLTVLPDTDGDGTTDASDSDDDGDGTPDGSDDLPLDDSETVDTDGDGIGNVADTDDDGDGVPDNDDLDPLDPDVGAEAPPADADSDGVPDSEDAFPTDPAASLDADDDGYPDAWNPGYMAEDSTTGLELDDDPLMPHEEGGGMMLYLAILIIIVAVIGVALMFKPKAPKPTSEETPEAEPEATEPSAAPATES